jgi:hypothetical protein
LRKTCSHRRNLKNPNVKYKIEELLRRGFYSEFWWGQRLHPADLIPLFPSGDMPKNPIKNLLTETRRVW